MRLSVKLSGRDAKLFSGTTQIGNIKLDHYWQIAEVTIAATATPEQAEKIIRLAASHAAQFVVQRKISHVGGLLLQTLPPTPDTSPAYSQELLDFDAIAPQHNNLKLSELEPVLRRIGVKVHRS